MALQKKNNLLRAHLVVTLFWFVLLFFVTQKFSLKLLAGSITYAVMVVIGGIACGVALWVAIDASRRGGILAKGGEHRLRGAKSSIGALPVAIEPERGKMSEFMLTERFPWWAKYASQHPGHAEAFRAVLSVMSANPQLPASPVPGGHGGATLIDHSFNVVDTMMQMAPKWVYRGHKNRKGEVAFPLLDTTTAEFRFASGDPIIPLAAFAHDIGKMVCYKQIDGSIREVKRNHDIEGAKLLRTLPEVMNLSWKDKVALLTACEFYHHLGSIPYSTWIDDRARSLIELLIAADIATGQREGGVIVGEYEDTDLVVGQPSKAANPVSDTDMQDCEESPVDTTDMASSHVVSAMDAIHGSALDLTYSVLLEPGRVNGTNAATRIAWKHGEWLYISDAKLRSAVAGKTGDSGYNALPHRGNMHAFTMELMAQLAEGKNLLQEHNGRKFSEKRAIYTTRSAVSGKAPVENRFVIVAKVDAFPGLGNAADCKVAPEIIECSWGETAAVNKAVRVNSDASMGSESIDSSDLPLMENVLDAQEERETLLAAAASMSVPYVEKLVDGEAILFFEEEVIRQEYPEMLFDGEQFIKKTGGNSGKVFIGIRKKNSETFPS